jgi:Family of unknown function (DUF5677)
MSKKRRQQNRQRKARRRNSPLSSHKQEGKKFIPPLMTMPNVGFVSWERDILPDYLLMAAFLLDKDAEDTHKLLRLLTGIDKVREKVRERLTSSGTEVPADEALAGGAAERTPDEAAAGAAPDDQAPSDRSENGQPHPAAVFTGRLTEFDDFIPVERKAVLEALLDTAIYEDLVPEHVFHLLGMYPEAPGSWLLKPWHDRGASVDPEVAERALGRLLLAAGPHQGALATRTKILTCNRWGQAGLMHVPAPMADEFNGWPYPEEDGDHNEMVETSYRSMFGTLGSLTPGDSDPAQAWAETFWRSNWQIYICRWPDDPLLVHPDDAGELDQAEGADGAAERGGEPDGGEETLEMAGEGAARVSYWRQTLDDARTAMEEIEGEFHSLAEKTDPDLYNPDRYEVLSGIVGRTLRYLTVFVGYPPLWTMEHGAPLLRALVEARIVLRFLEGRADPDLYAKFKSYGMGKLKLLKLHLENIIDEQDEPSPDLVQYVEYLDAIVNQDILEEFQQIDVGGNFAGVDTRRMATEAGLEHEYRLLFAPASSSVHGEWSIIDEYVFDRCRNPAHRRHRILRRDRDHRTGPMFLNSLLAHASLLISDYKTATESQRKLG